MGFEPTISCVTGRRALQAAPQGLSSTSTQSRIRTCKHLILSQVAQPVGVPGRDGICIELGWLDSNDRDLPIPKHKLYY